MKQTRIIEEALAFLVLALAVAGCNSGSSGVAKVGDRAVTQQEFDAYLAHKGIKLRDQAHADRILSEYVRREAMAEAIESQEVLDEKAVEAEMREFKKEMLISRYFEKFLKDKVGPDAIANYYNEHADDYADKKVHVAHVLVRTNRRTTEEERAAKRAKIQEAHSKLNAGEPFEKIAETYSEDKVSAPKGGDLGWIKEGSIHPTFSKQAFALAQDAVSPVIETPFGFHVLKVVEAPRVIRKPLKAVEGDIRYQLRSKAKEAEVARLKEVVSGTAEPGAYKVSSESAVSKGAATDAAKSARSGEGEDVKPVARNGQGDAKQEATP